MRAWVAIGTLVLGLAVVAPARASDVGYLYGRVVTVSGDQYVGELRWGKEEAFWDDFFNSDKVENDNLRYVDEADRERLRWRHPLKNWSAFFGDHDEDLTHLFAVRFGDLARLRVRGGDRVVAEFRNGEEIELQGGSNDIGADITVVDATRGEHVVKWSRIRTIEFRDTPARLARKLGDPLYGTVTAGKYEFTGRIQWDEDECLTGDELDGDGEDGRVSIAFGDIASIRKYRSGSLVKLKSGSQVYLRGTNDVNSDNRGILVKLKVGTVKVGWGDFDEVTFQRAPDSGDGYPAYGTGRELTGSVATSSGRYAGRIVYDLDESLDAELLQGKNGDTEYLIPFRDIVSIRREGLRRSIVKLTSGLTVELEDSQDVSRDNEGLLVFSDSHKPKYISWRDVEEVSFH